METGGGRIANLFQQEKAKWNAWKKEVDAGTTPEAAQKKYVEKVEELKNTLGYNA